MHNTYCLMAAAILSLKPEGVYLPVRTRHSGQHLNTPNMLPPQCQYVMIEAPPTGCRICAPRCRYCYADIRRATVRNTSCHELEESYACFADIASYATVSIRCILLRPLAEVAAAADCYYAGWRRCHSRLRPRQIRVSCRYVTDNSPSAATMHTRPPQLPIR